MVNFKKWFTEKGAEHYPEFFLIDNSRCQGYMCTFSGISLDTYFHFWVSRKPHFHNYGMENVLGRHINNETKHVLTMSDEHQVPWHKTSISIIDHSCLLICLEPERELAFVQYLQIYILKIKSNTTQILVYMERAQGSDSIKRFLSSSSFPGQDMRVQTWWIVLLPCDPFFAY